jgi:hypothetical protein
VGLIAKAKGDGIAPVDAGTWTAVCVGYADLGTQRSDFGGEVREARKVMLFWDIPELRMEYEGKDKPRRISARYTLSLGKKASLRAVLEAWRGRAFTEQELDGFDLANLIGKGCLLLVTHEAKQDGGVFAKVKGVMALPKGMGSPALETDPIRYEIEDGVGHFNMPPESVPEWVRKIIAESYEYKQAHGIGVGAPPPGAVNSTREAPPAQPQQDEEPW